MKTRITPGAPTLVEGLAGAAALAAGTSSYATIIVAPVPLDIQATNSGIGGIRTWDVDGNGTIDFTIDFNRSALPWFWSDYFRTTGAGSGVIASLTGGDIMVTHLGAGFSVGPNNSFYSPPSTTVLLAEVYSGLPYNLFSQGIPGYVGFRFQAGGQNRYGWLLLQTSYSIGIDFIAAAYDDGGGATLTGQTPAPGTLAALAFGAAALLKRGRKRAG